MRFQNTMHYTSSLFYDGTPSATLTPGGLRGRGEHVLTDLLGEELALALDALEATSRLRLRGRISPEDIRLLARLPALRHLDLTQTPALSPDALGALGSLTLEHLSLRVVAPQDIAALSGLALHGLSLRLGRGDASDPASWHTLAELGLTHLFLKSPHALPGPATLALAESGLRSLAHLELLGTHIASLELTGISQLEVLRVQHVRAMVLRDLPALRLAPVMGHATLDGLSALENVVAVDQLETLSVESTPALQRIELEWSYASDEADRSARATGAEVRVDTTAKKAKPSAPKRKVCAKQRAHAKLGWGVEPTAVLVSGRRATCTLSDEVAKALDVVGAHWSIERGTHLAAVPGVDASGHTDLGGSIDELVVGHVLGFVDSVDASTDLDLTGLRELMGSIDVDLEDLWSECDGVAKTHAFTEDAALYLVACGLDACAELAADGGTLARVDEQVIACARLDWASLPDAVTLSLRRSGLRWRLTP